MKDKNSTQLQNSIISVKTRRTIIDGALVIFSFIYGGLAFFSNIQLCQQVFLDVAAIMSAIIMIGALSFAVLGVQVMRQRLYTWCLWPLIIGMISIALSLLSIFAVSPFCLGI